MTELPGTGRRPFVKICGVRTPEDLAVCAACGVDAIGLVLAPGSPRRLDLHEALGLFAGMPAELEPIGLFVDPEMEVIEVWPGSWIQLHGEETPERVASIAAETGHRIIKAIRFDPEECRRWDEHPAVSMLLVDGPRGGSGEPFDHSRLAEVLPELSTPVIVAGGLGPENVGDVVRDLGTFGVDVSSGVESTRGVKDHDRIRGFVAAARG
ncbi:MAG: N-(5'-phosphoribosyl)anthranilate isomerase [Planctomycetaceae bacterium]|nr:N-(5'-phosphoribosyl)anthranilate isomerase [Planctomycetaceae bacterium]